MRVIDAARLIRDQTVLAREFAACRPFKYIVIDDFLNADQARRIYSEFPEVDQSWDDVNGPHQKKKFSLPATAGSVAEEFYREANSPEFLRLLGSITGIPRLLPDDTLRGAGYHQILDGGFLNVHVDFNKLGELDRRLNLIVYLNPEWAESFGGYLELWDMGKRERLASIAPAMNRCVIFETNEISFHGHPVRLNTGGVTRKSLSVYYYSQGREDIVAAPEHTTVFVNTLGTAGSIRTAGRKGIYSALWVWSWIKRIPNAPRRLGRYIRYNR